MQAFLDSAFTFVKFPLIRQWEDLYFFGIYIGIILFLFVYKNELTKYFSWYTLFLFATVFNPILAKPVFEFFEMDVVYYRFFWLMPVNIVIAYLFVHILEQYSKTWKKCIVTLVLIWTVILAGKPIFNIQHFTSIPDNLYKVSDQVLQVCDYIHLDSEEENPKVAPAFDLVMVMRQYDPSIQVTIYRDLALCWQGSSILQSEQKHGMYQYQKPIMDVLYSGDTSDTYSFLLGIYATETDYIVHSKGVDIQQYLIDNDFEYVGDSKDFAIYRVPHLEYNDFF